MAERPIPELPMPVPVTRHLALCLSLYSILHTRYSRIFWSTEPLMCSPYPLVTLPACPLAASPRSPLHCIRASLAKRSTQIAQQLRLHHRIMSQMLDSPDDLLDIIGGTT
jgi:hypothetical protein